MNIDEKALLEVVAHGEAYSNHPISRSIRQAWGGSIDFGRVSDVEEITGHGICAKVDGRMVYAGNGRMMEKYGIDYVAAAAVGTVVYIAIDGVFAGSIVIADQLKDDAKSAIDGLRSHGVRRVVMLTGDSAQVGRAVGDGLGMDETLCELLPGDKVMHIERLMKSLPKGGTLAFTGDGINDAPVLSRSDVGIAMGALGSDAAIEAADVVIMNDKPSAIVSAIGIARKTLRIVHQNIVFALGVKIVVMVLGAMGLANMWAAVFADVGVSVIAILNAMRMLRYRGW